MVPALKMAPRRSAPLRFAPRRSAPLSSRANEFRSRSTCPDSVASKVGAAQVSLANILTLSATFAPRRSASTNTASRRSAVVKDALLSGKPKSTAPRRSIASKRRPSAGVEATTALLDELQVLEPLGSLLSVASKIITNAVERETQ